MDDERLFHVLRPEPAQIDAAVAAIMAAAGPALARRRHPDVLGLIGEWQRPMLIAAAILLAASIGVLVGQRSQVQRTRSAMLAEAVGVPADLAEWADGGSPPPAAYLVFVSWRDR